MPFADFHGHAPVVAQLRDMMSRERLPHSIILAGPEGAGKYTLALMVAKAMNCLQPPPGAPDFCGRCNNCTRIALSDDLEARFQEAVEARENLREADKKDTRLFVQTHPDVLVIPPDPPQMMIKVDQVRHLIAGVHYSPSAGKRRFYIFTEASFMKEAANSLLKVLEEPPDFATLFLLAENPGELLPTIRSRCIAVRLAPVGIAELEAYLTQCQPRWGAGQRALVARLAGGGIGRARSFNLEAYTAARKDAFLLLESSLHREDHSALFRATETYRAGVEGKARTDQLIRALYSVLEDLLVLYSGQPGMVRNTDALPQLKKLAAGSDFAWIATAAQRLGEVESGMRRNLLRSLALDAFATGLEPAPGRAPL